MNNIGKMPPLTAFMDELYRRIEPTPVYRQPPALDGRSPPSRGLIGSRKNDTCRRNTDTSYRVPTLAVTAMDAILERLGIRWGEIK